MKIRIISGGQTGADKGGLLGAHDLGIETGGYAPLGWRTENGPDLSLKKFGLIEAGSSDYKSRTRMNARDSHLTLWFGAKNTPGFKCTRSACNEAGVIFKIVDLLLLDRVGSIHRVRVIIRSLMKQYDDVVINVAGNRESKNPGIQRRVRRCIRSIFSEIEKGAKNGP